LQEPTDILQDIELSRLYLSTRSSWQPATNIQWSCTAKPVQTNGCKSQIDAENRQQSKESSLHLHYRKEKLSSYSDGLLNIQIAEETKPQIHSCSSQEKKNQNQNTQSNSPRLIPHGICASSQEIKDGRKH
jgi:hypothetical protein